MSQSLNQFASQKLAALDQRNLLRTLVETERVGPIEVMRGGKRLISFSCNDYLNLSQNEKIKAAAIEATEKWGVGAGASRLVTGNHPLFAELEEKLAKLKGAEAACVFGSGYLVNTGIIPALAGDDDMVCVDELSHACIYAGAGLSKGKIHVFRHNDVGHLSEILGAHRDAHPRALIVTDGVFSMEGDIAKLPEIRKLCDEYGAMLAVDDSHGTGVMGQTGRGTHEHHGMAGDAIDFYTGTLGKALGGGAGGYLAGTKRGMDMIVQRARPTLFTNALPVTVACSANKAIEILMREPQRVQKLRDNVAYARKGISEVGFEVLESPSAICPIIVGDTAKAIAMSKRLLELGVYVIGFGYPVVPEGTARLRVQLSAAHEKEHLDTLIECLTKLKAEIG